MNQTPMLRINPFDQLRTLPALMERMFAWPAESASDMPAMLDNLPLDVYERNDQLVVRAALPGVTPSDVSIQITDDLLQIAAQQTDGTDVKRNAYYLRECEPMHWYRSVRLPSGLQADRATASYTDGYLTLTIPRAPTARPRSVEVKLQ